MLTWISQNLATILISAALIVILALVVAVLIRDKRKGKSSCGGNCAHCPMGGCAGHQGHEKKTSAASPDAAEGPEAPSSD